MRVIVIYLQYDPNKYKGYLSDCKNILNSLSQDRVDYLVVDNAHPGQWIRKDVCGDTWIGGDNESWEFTGWNRALQYLRKKGEDYDVLIMCNDAFKTNIVEYQRYLSPELLQYVINHEISAGIVQYMNSIRGLAGDFILKSVPFEIKGIIHYNWARSNIVIIPYKRFISTILTFHRDCDFFPTEYDEDIFSRIRGMSVNLKQHLFAYLCPTISIIGRNYWHSHFRLNVNTYPLFCKKASSIINELHLTRILHDTGCPVVDFRLINALHIIERVCRIVSNTILTLYKSNQLCQNNILFIYAVVIERKGMMHKVKHNGIMPNVANS
ncbi:MAG: hypothetical protein ACYDEX_22535 [Mobilitalea sp.]